MSKYGHCKILRKSCIAFLLEIYKKPRRNPEINGILIEPVRPESSEVCPSHAWWGGVDTGWLAGWEGPQGFMEGFQGTVPSRTAGRFLFPSSCHSVKNSYQFKWRNLLAADQWRLK